jgi:hypothetical protein
LVTNDLSLDAVQIATIYANQGLKLGYHY